MEAGPDSLFPLQGALGYDIHQALFVGPNCVVVEGVSDLLYLQTVSNLLQRSGRVFLDPRWAITPVGGADKVPTFVALIGSQRNLNIATLIDIQKGDRQTIENLYKKKLLKKSRVLTFADFTGKDESDIEDMFDEDDYIKLVNEEYSASLPTRLSAAELKSKAPRVIVKIDEFLQSNPMTGGVAFNHYRPARLFAERATSVTLAPATLDRFENAFKALNALLPA